MSRSARAVAITMGSIVAVDLVLGVGALLAVPYHRHNSLAPQQGRAIYLAHALIGAVLGVAAVAILPKARLLDRPVWLGAVTGAVGVGVAAVGGLLTTVQSARLIGMALMLLGAAAAEAGYLMPLVDTVSPDKATTNGTA
jgi:hypothetical protein